MPNVKEHATLSARASVDHGVEVETTGGHVNRAAGRGCMTRLVRFVFIVYHGWPYMTVTPSPDKP